MRELAARRYLHTEHTCLYLALRRPRSAMPVSGHPKISPLTQQRLSHRYTLQYLALLIGKRRSTLNTVFYGVSR